MAEETPGFAQARLRLEEIVTQVRKKDVSLEKSLDLLEEGVRLANRCTELIDRADWDSDPAVAEEHARADAGQEESPSSPEAADEDEDASTSTEQ